MATFEGIAQHSPLLVSGKRHNYDYDVYRAITFDVLSAGVGRVVARVAGVRRTQTGSVNVQLAGVVPFVLASLELALLTSTGIPVSETARSHR